VRIVPALASGGDGTGLSWTGAPATGAAGAAVAAACGRTGAVAPPQTGSTAGADAGAGLAGAWAAELLACLCDFLVGAGGATGMFAWAVAAPAATAAGAVAVTGPFGSGFMMLIGGIESAVGKSMSTVTFFCPGAPDWFSAVDWLDVASATGTSGDCAHTVT